MGVDETSFSARGARILHQTIRRLAHRGQRRGRAGPVIQPAPSTSSATSKLSRSDELFICLIAFLEGMTSRTQRSTDATIPAWKTKDPKGNWCISILECCFKLAQR